MNTETETSLLGGDEVHAATFGRLDYAAGDPPDRFEHGEAKHLRPFYLRGYREQQMRKAIGQTSA